MYHIILHRTALYHIALHFVCLYRSVLYNMTLCRTLTHCIASRLTVSYHITNVEISGAEKLTLSQTTPPHLVLCVSCVSLYRT